jgi:response regulator RpfG family c-di-GMP phosphodiesterase
MADRPRVLLCDSDVHCTEALEPAMQHITDLIVAKTTDEAVQKMAEKPFDVVLVEPSLPGQGGMWLLQQIQAQSPNTKRVLLTGIRPTNFPALLQSGLVHALVRKPALIDHLVATVIGKQAAAPAPAQQG